MMRHVQIAFTAVVMALLLFLAVSAAPDRDGSPARTWGTSQTVLDPDPGFWRSQANATSPAARTYAVGMSDPIAMSRITVSPGSALELTNLGASGAFVLESGGLILSHTEGIVELRRGGSSIATALAPIGIGSQLERGDRLAFRSAVTIGVRNPEDATASILVIANRQGLSFEGAPQG